MLSALGTLKYAYFSVSCPPASSTPSNPWPPTSWKYSGNYQCIITDSSFLLKALSYKSRSSYRKHFLVLQVFSPILCYLITTITAVGRGTFYPRTTTGQRADIRRQTNQGQISSRPLPCLYNGIAERLNVNVYKTPITTSSM